MGNTFISAISSGEAFKIACSEPLPEYAKLLNQNLEPQNVKVAKGFKFTGLNAGIKYETPDLMLMTSTPPAVSAGVFTTNTVRAACVGFNEIRVHGSEKISAIVCNSGNANACTGEQGEHDNQAMADLVANTLGISASSVLVASTGVIGQLLPMQKIESGIQKSAQHLNAKSLDKAALGIMTTDTFSKFLSIEVELTGNDKITISAIAKGSGMICPNMATMLAFIATDASIEKPLLQQTLSELNQSTFNAISVDGDTSTNDMALMLANGESKTPTLKEGSEDYERFKTTLHYLLRSLAKLIVLDGEGATKFIELDIQGAKTLDDARKHAHTIAHSSLFKTAMFGEDANWGRILAAMGRSGGEIKPELATISFNGLPILNRNFQVVFNEYDAKQRLLNRVIKVEINLGLGDVSSKFWTTDLSDKYIFINADYRT